MPAITYGTLAQNSAAATATSIATSTTLTVSAGQSILCWGSYSAASDKTVTFSDGTNTYTAVGAFRDTTSQFGIACAVALNVAAGTYTITATYSATAISRAVVAIPLTNVAGFTAGEFSTNTQAAPGAGTDAITSGNVTPATVPGDLITMVLNVTSSSLPTGGTSQTTRALFWQYGTGSSFARYESRRRTVTTASAGTYTAAAGGVGHTYLTFATFLRESTTTATTLTAAQGSFTLTGVAAGLTSARNLAANVGSFALTGKDASLAYTPASTAYALTAQSGSFALTGNAASLVFSGTVPEAFTGGFFVAFEREQHRRERARRKRTEDEEAAQRIADEIEREIAALLHKQEAQDAERLELQHLGRLVAEFADREAQDAFNERVRAAFVRAQAQMTASSLLALDREIRRQLEEEEMAVLMAIALID